MHTDETQAAAAAAAATEAAAASHQLSLKCTG